MGSRRLVGHVLAHLVFVALLTVIGVGTACLSSLPEPIQCPPTSVYSACPLRPPASLPGNPSPGVPVGDSGSGPGAPTVDGGGGGPGGPSPVGPPGTDLCVIDFIECLKQQGRQCACSPDVECKRTGATCNLAPDCPASIRNSEGGSGATCIETSASFVVGARPPCVCGCPSCAATCDGQGPVIVPNETIRFDLPGDLPATGRISIMARMRGGGGAFFEVRTLDGPSMPLGQAAADSDFSEKIAQTGTSGRAEYSWGGDRLRPIAIELHGGPESAVEVDCVVPFLSR